MNLKALNIANCLLEADDIDPKEYALDTNLVYGYESIYTADGEDALEYLDLIEQEGPRAAIRELKHNYVAHGEHETYRIGGGDAGEPDAVNPAYNHFTDPKDFTISWRQEPPFVSFERAVRRRSPRGRFLAKIDREHDEGIDYIDLKFGYPELWARIAAPYIKKRNEIPKYRHMFRKDELPERWEARVRKLMNQALDKGIKK